MESVGFDERAGGGSRSSTVAWPHVNSIAAVNLRDPRVQINIPHDTCVPMQKSLRSGMAQDHLSERWRPFSMKLLLKSASVVTDAYYELGREYTLRNGDFEISVNTPR